MEWETSSEMGGTSSGMGGPVVEWGVSSRMEDQEWNGGPGVEWGGSSRMGPVVEWGPVIE